MRLVFLLVAAATMAAGSVFGQAGSIGLYSDAAGTDCGYVDAAPGLMVVHVVHQNTPGAVACQFAIEDGPGFTGVWLSDTPPFPIVVGSTHSPEGIALGYGLCLASPIHVMSVDYFAQGTSAPCSWMRVIPPPASPSGQIDVVDCANNLVAGTGGTLIINPTDDCVCDVPADNSTWGAVKAIYSR